MEEHLAETQMVKDQFEVTMKEAESVIAEHTLGASTKPSTNVGEFEAFMINVIDSGNAIAEELRIRDIGFENNAIVNWSDLSG